ncbi:MAG: extracellular solute-binding protein [Anaerolineae bacterium]
MLPRAWLFLMVIALFLSACGASATPTATPEPLEITFSYYNRALEPYYQQMKADFEAAHPRWQVVLKTGNAFGGNMPESKADVAEVMQLPIATLAKNGTIRPLDPLIQESGLDLDSFYQSALDASRWQGQLWGLPLGVDPLVLYYNKDIFASKGVPYPNDNWTWDDLLEAALRLTDPTAEPPLYGLAYALFGGDLISFIYQNGGTLFDSLIEPTTITLTDPATVEAIEWYANLALAHEVMPAPRELDAQGGSQTLIISQRAAMWYGSLSERGGKSWGMDWKFNWGIAPPPAGKQRASLLWVRTCVLSAQSPHPQAAWQWARYVATHPPTDYDVPALKEAAEADSLFATEAAEVAAAARVSLASGYAFPSVAWLAELGNWLSRALDDIFRGDVSVAEALIEAQERANERLGQ